MNNTLSLRILTIILLSFFVVSCSSNSAQQQFEREANGPAKNYTHTDNQGKIVNNQKDPNDWRIAPMFQGLIQMMYPPYPNPVKTNQKITFEFTVSGLQAIYGIDIYVRTYNPQPRLIYQESTSPLPPGLTTIKLNPLLLSPTGNPDNAQGLHRIFIYDNNDNLITYGDIMVQ